MALTTEQQMLVEQKLQNEKKSMGVAYLLWFFLGTLGGHRFYLGRSGTGAVMLVLWLLGIATIIIAVGFVLLIPLGIWALVDAFLIPGMIESDTRERRRILTLEVGVDTRVAPA